MSHRQEFLIGRKLEYGERWNFSWENQGTFHGGFPAKHVGQSRKMFGTLIFRCSGEVDEGR